MKYLHDFAKTLTDALAAVEGARAAEERAKSAQQAAARALSNAENARIAADKTKADADAHVRARKAEQEKHDAEAYGVWARERAQHLAWIENAKGQVSAASESLTALQKEIAAAREQRDAINAELGKLRAAFADSAAKL
jgi:hypothetical protein